MSGRQQVLGVADNEHLYVADNERLFGRQRQLVCEVSLGSYLDDHSSWIEPT